MEKTGIHYNPLVTDFLNDLHHPLRTGIEELRQIVLSAGDGLTENIKWNGPNYALGGADRITMKIQPPKQIQLIFHRGAKKQEQPKSKLITDASGLLLWKENDRAIVTFKDRDDIETKKAALAEIVQKWLEAAK